MKKNSVWFLGGLSGGHLYPLFSIIKAQQAAQDKNECYLFIPEDDLIKKIVFDQDNIFFSLKKFFYPKPKQSWRVILFLFYSVIVFFKIFYYCLFYRPKKMYSTGGYFSVPFSLCAWWFKIPFTIYHLDVQPGLAGKLIGYFSNVTQCIVNKETEKYLKNKKNIILTDYPIRYLISDKIDVLEAKKNINKSNYLVIFVLGGSQGSEEINDYMSSALETIQFQKLYVIHQTGLNQKHKMISLYAKYGIQSFVFDYSNNLLPYYNSADIIIARAGAGTLSEINFFQKPALIIPLKKIAGNHQVENALLFEKKNDLIKVCFDKELFLLEIKKYTLLK